MNVTPRSISCIVIAARRAIQLSDVLSSEFTNGTHNAIDDIYGSLIDAMCFMCGDHSFSTDESLVYNLVMNPSISEKQVADILINHTN